MTDNCQNKWGCFLSVCSNSRNKSKNKSGDDRDLRDNIAATFKNEFVLVKVMECGSDANMFAVMCATDGNTNALLVGAGCYVSGDHGPLQSYSSSELSLRTGFSCVTNPSKVKNPFTKQHTVALPYRIEGVMNARAEKNYEDSCIEKLHLRCLLAMVNRCPFKAILLELMLASNGCSLSDRFLVMLGKLAKTFELTFIVDEVMTAGRTGTMLMLQQKPKEFQECVSLVTLGKWTQKGMVLATATFHDETQHLAAHTESRMVSLHADCSDVIMHWNAVKKNLPNHEVRRSMVLETLKMNPKDAWGEGTLMFAPIRRSGICEGLLNRLLPVLDIGLKVDRIQATRNVPELSKTKINAKTVATIKEWIKDQPNLGKRYILTYKLVEYIVEHAKEQHKFSTFEIDVLEEKESSIIVSNLLGDLLEAGLLDYKLVGKERHRRWIARDVCIKNTFIID